MTSANPPFWARENPRREFDVKRLRPGDLPLGQRFETTRDACRYSAMRQKRIEREPNLHGLASSLQSCRTERVMCGKPFCPICARRYRRWMIGQALPFFEREDAPAFFITLYLEEQGSGELAAADLYLLKRRLRARLRRTLPLGAILIGGIEANFADGRWIVHAHLASVGVNREHFAGLVGSRNQAKDLDIRRLLNVTQQVSYLQKFATFHRPGKQTGARRARAYPLPKARLHELASWMDGHAFEDFLVLYGIRRRGSRLLITEHS